MRTATGFLALVPLLLAFHALAAMPDQDRAAFAAEVLSRSQASADLRDSVASGELSEHDARMQRFYATFRPDLLDPAFGGMLDGTPDCATDLLASLHGHWSTTPASDKHLIASETSPVYRAWLADGGISWLDGDVDTERELARAACFTPQSVNPQLGPYNEVTTSDHFEMHWNSGSGATQVRVDDLLEWFEESWQLQVIESGFFQPQGMSLNHMLVTVEELGNDSLGAYATISQCGSGGYMTYIVVNESTFNDPERLRSIAPHEFFHGVQFVYGIEEFWFDQDSDNRWLVEAAATFMSRVVYPWLYSAESRQSLRWATEPHRSLETADNSGLQYGLVVFLLSLNETVGGNEWHQLLWEQIRDRSGFDLKDELDILLADWETDFISEWRKFIIRGAVGMEENETLYSPINLSDQTFGQVEDRVVGRHDGRDYPIDEAVNGESGLDRPEFLGTNYAIFEGDRIDDDLGAVLRFRGDGNRNGETVDWVVELAAVYNDSVRATHSMVLTQVEDDSGEVEDVVGEVLVNELGEDFDYVVMAVSPITDFGDGDISWSYQGELVDSTGNGGFADAPTGDDDDDGGTGCSDCGASVARTDAGHGPWAALLLGALLTRRRKGEQR